MPFYNDIGYTFQPLNDEHKNIVKIHLWLECGCDFDKGEYGISLAEIVQGMINKDDFDYFDECIKESYCQKDLPDEAILEFTLVESGEWQGFEWCKWYEIQGEPINRIAESEDE